MQPVSHLAAGCNSGAQISPCLSPNLPFLGLRWLHIFVLYLFPVPDNRVSGGLELLFYSRLFNGGDCDHVVTYRQKGIGTWLSLTTELDPSPTHHQAPAPELSIHPQMPTSTRTLRRSLSADNKIPWT